MQKSEENATQTLLEKKYITEKQFREIEVYRSLNLFSLHDELKMLLYLSVILFTSGIGILIYQNIDTIGHIVLLSILLLVTVVCFYYCFKNHAGFSRNEAPFVNPLYDYLLLAATILSCTFIGYLQFQYQPFGNQYGLMTLIPTVICFFCAYYFDNKSVLSIGITGLAAYLGLTLDPKQVFENEMINNTTLSYIGLALGISLLLWVLYATKNNLKKHFNLVYLNFSLHLVSIACIVNLWGDYWLLFASVLGVFTYYFYTLSYRINAMSLFLFIIIYAYIGFNIFFVRILDHLDLDDIFALFYILPIYFIASIIAFIKLIKNFNKRTPNDRLQ
jgi:hypothetical protein